MTTELQIAISRQPPAVRVAVDLALERRGTLRDRTTGTVEWMRVYYALCRALRLVLGLPPDSDLGVYPYRVARALAHAAEGDRDLEVRILQVLGAERVPA